MIHFSWMPTQTCHHPIHFSVSLPLSLLPASFWPLPTLPDLFWSCGSARHGGCQPYPPGCCCPAHLSLSPAALNHFPLLPFLFWSPHPSQIGQVSLGQLVFIPSFVFFPSTGHLISIFFQCVFLALETFPGFIGRRVARIHLERLRKGYCHHRTIITSAVRQTAVHPQTCMHIWACEVRRNIIVCLNVLLTDTTASAPHSAGHCCDFLVHNVKNAC